jgi:putative heme-binding domain-containing protein
LRAEALQLMAGETPRDPAWATILDSALAARTPAALHRVALASLLPGFADRLVREAGTVLLTRTLPEKQHAIGLLASAAVPAADAAIDGLAADLLAGKGEAGLRLEIVEALRARGAANPALAVRLQEYESSPAAAARAELLAGGDSARGRELVANHLAANCTACHTVESSSGSAVGPNLRAIGAERDAAYLLESLVAPSAKIATGYGIVHVTLQDKSEVTGTLAKETPGSVTVRLFDGKQQIIPRTEIATLTPPVSIMPPMLGILQPREIRDVVSYLASLKGGRRSPPAEREGGG